MPTYCIFKLKSNRGHDTLIGKKKVKSMHIYMEPLIDEFLELYEHGIPAFDVSAPPGREEFTLKAALLWTIHDWPGM
jgi:hypothetical protein